MAPSDKQDYEVNWKSQMSHMKEAFESLFHNNEFVDVTLYCEDRKIGAHKMVLSACSPYFRGIFKDVPCQHHVIVLNNVDFSIMESIMQFIYHGQVSVHNSRLSLFLQTARMLKISGLMDAASVRDADDAAVEPLPQASEAVITKRKRGAAGEVRQRAVKLRPDNAAAPPPNLDEDNMGLMMDVVKCEPVDLVFEEDPLRHDSSLNDYNMQLQETQDLIRQEEFECEKMEDTISTNEDDQDDDDEASKDLFLPSKSKQVYEDAYNAYRKWCCKTGVITTTNDSILAYFNSDLSHYASSTLWTRYSMLRSTISLHEAVDISQFPNVISYLKRKGEGQKRKKSLTLTKKEIDEFLIRADDREHLLNKVILIIGIAGGCRRQELVSLTTSCVEDYQTHFLIRLVDAESKRDHRSFIVAPGETPNLNLLDIVRAYTALRPSMTRHNRFFIAYTGDKCTVQPVGINRFGIVPALVAKFLNLDNPTSYTGHCFRRTSALL